MKKLLIIIFIFLGLAFSQSAYAQTGGRKKERKAKPRGNFVLKRYKSHGNADKFARGNSGRRSKWARLFTKEKPSWVYKRSGSKSSQYRANKFLFFRERSPGLIDNETTLKAQNKKRSRQRVRGNTNFKSKKY